jgi:hypothetical protein
MSGGAGGEKIRTGIVGGRDLAFLDVVEKVVDGVVIGALVAGLVGIPGGDLVVEEEVVRRGREVAGMVQVRGRVRGWQGVSRGQGRGTGPTV